MDKATIKRVPPSVLAKMQGHEAKGWKARMQDHPVSDVAMDLLSRLVVIDHTERITAAEALRHPYFDHIRE